MLRQTQILLAEDEETDVFLLRQALRRAGVFHELIVAQDGKEAIEQLSESLSSHIHHQSALPALVVLDLKMPRMTGFDVLAWLQAEPLLKTVPAVVLTSSTNDLDRQRARQLGAADFLIKPSTLAGLVEVVRQLQERWLTAPTAP